MMITDRTVLVVGVLALVLLAGRTTNAQRARGELRIEVRDPQGAVVPTEAELVSDANQFRSEEHTSELQSQSNLVCRLLLEKKKKKIYKYEEYTYITRR